MTHRYLLHGLVVESDVRLEAEQAPSHRSSADLVVRTGGQRVISTERPVGRAVALLDDPRLGLRHAVVAVDSGWLIRFPGAAEVEIDEHLSTAVAHVDPDFSVDLLAVLVAGFVVATLLQLRGDPVLHASAVEVDGLALAVVGPSGTGKSTTASVLCAAGARLVSDDVLRLSLTGDAARTWRGPGSTRLRAQAASLAAGLVISTSADGRTVARLPRARSDQLDLAAVLLPRPRRDLRAVEVARLTGMAALLPLVSSPRILGWCDARSLAEQMQQLSALASIVPVVEVHMPWGPPFPRSLGVAVVDALRDAQVLASGSSTA